MGRGYVYAIQIRAAGPSAAEVEEALSKAQELIERGFDKTVSMVGQVIELSENEPAADDLLHWFQGRRKIALDISEAVRSKGE